MADIIELTDSTFESEILRSDLPAIVDFWAEWCMPCKMLGPIIDEIAKEFTGKIKIGKINVDENTKIATNLTVMNIPTLLFFKDGQEAGRVSGAISKKEILKKISEIFNE